MMKIQELVDKIIDALIEAESESKKAKPKPRENIQTIASVMSCADGMTSADLNALELVMELEEAANVEISDLICEEIIQVYKVEGKEKAQQMLMKIVNKV
ncbi:hypothetical protein [Nostoc sp. LEGE 12450]|uniref:hypothetical protein n=1 Tax=Nostoc sp. LEGE 12450 TaxID=1828643 RepID=UPI001882B8B0|nr:hypothetical protein [Nostoc sp. LEGE 12450]MBE8990381.1 hypothetical protein [Nostoc sp. LEGE 12450]